MLKVIHPTESDCHIPLLRLCIIEMCRVYGCSILHYTNCLLDIFPRDVVSYFPLGRKTMVKGNGTEEKMTIPHCIVTTPNSELLARNSQMGLEYIATQLQHLTRKTSLQFAIIQGHVNQHRALLKQPNLRCNRDYSMVCEHACVGDMVDVQKCILQSGF